MERKIEDEMMRVRDIHIRREMMIIFGVGYEKWNENDCCNNNSNNNNNNRYEEQEKRQNNINMRNENIKEKVEEMETDSRASDGTCPIDRFFEGGPSNPEEKECNSVNELQNKQKNNNSPLELLSFPSSSFPIPIQPWQINNVEFWNE
jgi:hypothetical protein